MMILISASNKTIFTHSTTSSISTSTSPAELIVAESGFSVSELELEDDGPELETSLVVGEFSVPEIVSVLFSSTPWPRQSGQELRPVVSHCRIKLAYINYV